MTGSGRIVSVCVSFLGITEVYYTEYHLQAGNAGSIPATSTNFKLIIMNIENFIKDQYKMLDRGIVATPDREYLERFAESNGGSADLLLMQLAMNFGYKLAIEELEHKLNTNT